MGYSDPEVNVVSFNLCVELLPRIRIFFSITNMHRCTQSAPNIVTFLPNPLPSDNKQYL